MFREAVTADVSVCNAMVQVYFVALTTAPYENTESLT